MRPKVVLAFTVLLITVSSTFVPEVKTPVPATIAQSDSAFMTKYPNQLKVFYDLGRFWVFFHNSSDRIYLATSADGLIFERATTVVNSGVADGSLFTAYLDEKNHKISYFRGDWEAYYRRGTLQSNGTISWDTLEQTVTPYKSDYWLASSTYTGYSNIYRASTSTGSENQTTEVVVGTAAVGSLFYIDPFQNTTSSFGTIPPSSITMRGWRTSLINTYYTFGGWIPYIVLKVRATDMFKGRIGVRFWNSSNADMSGARALTGWQWLDEQTYSTLNDEVTTSDGVYVPSFNMNKKNQYLYYEFIFNVTQAGASASAGFKVLANNHKLNVRTGGAISYANAQSGWPSLVEDSYGYPYVLVEVARYKNATIELLKSSLANGTWAMHSDYPIILLADVPSNNYNNKIVALADGKLMALAQTSYHQIGTWFYDGTIWHTKENVSNTSYDYPYYKPSWSAVSDGKETVYTVWTNYIPDYPPTTHHLRFSKWTEIEHWSTPQSLEESDTGYIIPSISISGSGVVSFWYHNTTHILYRQYMNQSLEPAWQVFEADSITPDEAWFTGVGGIQVYGNEYYTLVVWMSGSMSPYILRARFTTMPADVNSNGLVDILDLFTISKAYLSQIGEPAYRPEADTNKDGIIDDQDVRTLSTQYGEHP